MPTKGFELNNSEFVHVNHSHLSGLVLPDDASQEVKSLVLDLLSSGDPEIEAYRGYKDVQVGIALEKATNLLSSGEPQMNVDAGPYVEDDAPSPTDVERREVATRIVANAQPLTYYLHDTFGSEAALNVVKQDPEPHYQSLLNSLGRIGKMELARRAPLIAQVASNCGETLGSNLVSMLDMRLRSS